MLDEFFYCYKPQKISSSKGIYRFLARKPSLKLVSDIPDSNKNWMNKYFFRQGDGVGVQAQRMGQHAQQF